MGSEKSAGRKWWTMAADDARPQLRLTMECRRCHGLLFAPASIAAGIGPTCAIRERVEEREQNAHVLTLFDVAA